MKFTIEVQTFKSMLSRLGLAIASNPSLPVLEYILVNAEEGKVQLTTTNLLITVLYETACFTEGAAAKFLVPFSELKNIVSVVDGELSIEYTEESVYASTENDRWCLGKSGKVEDFPKAPTVADNRKFNIGNDFIPTLGIAALGVSHDEMKPAMCAICVELQKEKIFITTTDGNSIYNRVLPAELSIEENVQLLIPSEAAKALEGFDAARIGYNKNHISLETGPLQILCKRVDMNYPNWRSVYPVHDTNMTVKLRDFDDALAKAMIIADNIAHKGIDIYPRSEEVELHTKMEGNGMEAKCRIAGTSSSPVERIRLSGRLLKRMLKQLSGHAKHDDSICFSISNQMKACTIKVDGVDGVTVLIMPVSLN